ncbi:MAG: CoB--CoM heterodisulfide reductase iron-sulfur subunit A family protein, partial [Deltaproteobacteria bacterium]|nr:CoB--CoM heterodisulfide reductase iron-sulfur subunit A family protein [Deltaproteobacteria bacterium]
MPKIGVFVCQCGNNIESTVDTQKVADELKKMPGVEYTCSYKFMCSSPGQEMFKKAIKDNDLDSVLVSACSPHMHEKTFRKASEAAGLNSYKCEIVNIREQCSWVHHDETREIGTAKSLDLTRMMLERLKKNKPLKTINIPLTKRAMVVGGGIAGIQAALDIAEGGYEVILVEREPSIGGNMARLSETFPTMDCSQCILTPKMVEAELNERIKIMTYAEVEKIDGYIGNFTVTIKKKAKYVDESTCTGCGECWEKCPFKADSEFELGLSKRKVIYTPFPQSVPNIPVIDAEKCPKIQKDKCGLCQKVCGPGSIDFTQKDELVTEEVGAIVVATGYELMPNERFGEYGYGKIPDVISGMQFERLASSSGPTGGQIKRPSDGKTPMNTVFIQCVGSRDEAKGVSYCSKVCCMYSLKFAHLVHERIPDAEVYNFYIDIRTPGKGYEEFYHRLLDEGTNFIRGRVAEITDVARTAEEKGKLVVQAEDTLLMMQRRVPVDMVILSPAMEAYADSREVSQLFKMGCDFEGFFIERHPKLDPVATMTEGIYIAGACQGPKDIP